MQKTGVERVTHPSQAAAYDELAAHQSAGGTSCIVPVENGRWIVVVVGALQSRLLTTAGRLIKRIARAVAAPPGSTAAASTAKNGSGYDRRGGGRRPRTREERCAAAVAFGAV